MNIKIIVIIISVFALGVFAGGALSGLEENKHPTSTTTYVIANAQSVKESTNEHFITRVLGLSNEERLSPYDWVPESRISVEKDKVVIDIDNAQWSKFTDTNSMDPVIDEGANAIQIVPDDYSDIHAGDIVSYESEYAEGFIIHRVVETGFDESGWYCLMKGDNNPSNDPGKVRFSQIRRVVVAIIY